MCLEGSVGSDIRDYHKRLHILLKINIREILRKQTRHEMQNCIDSIAESIS